MKFTFIHINSKSEDDKVDILNWLINQVRDPKKGTVSMYELLLRYSDKITVEYNDVFNYHEIGWNFTDLADFFRVKQDSGNLEIPKPYCRFWRW